MKPAIKIKWLVSILLAGIVLILALLGGDWGTIYTADASTNAAPTITSISPSRKVVGSPYFIMIINGSNFGTSTQYVRVRLTGTGVDEMLEPIVVLPDGISVAIDAPFLTAPNVYSIKVIKSTKPSIPTLPIWPIVDEESNPATFTVFVPKYSFLPIIVK